MAAASESALRCDKIIGKMDLTLAKHSHWILAKLRAKLWLRGVIVFALILFCLYLVSFRLADAPDVDWDEGWTIATARLWVERGFYGRLLDGELAPPGLSASFPVVGSVALTMRFLGVGVWQGRLAAVITMAAALALYYWLLSRLFHWRIALATIAILILLAPHPRANAFWMARQMFAEPFQFLTCVGGFVCLLLARAKSSLWYGAAIIVWAAALLSKAQVLPFYILTSAALLGLNLLARRYRAAAAILVVFVGGFFVSQWASNLFDWALTGHTLPAQSLPANLFVLGFVPSLEIRLTAVIVAGLLGTPVILGLGYFAFQRARRKQWLRLQDRDDDLRIGLWVLATTWLLWYIFMAHAGITRYIFSPIFFGAPFAALLFRDLTDDFKLRATMIWIAAPLQTKRFTRKNLGAWLVFSLILFYLPLTLFISYQTLVAADGRALAAAADFLNQNTPVTARIETYESPFFIYLNRAYHYPPDALHLELNKRAAGLPAVVNYDALQSDPDYLVAPRDSVWHLYEPVIATGAFRPIQTFGRYTIYQRVRP